MLLVPVVAVAAPVVLLLAPLIGKLAFPAPPFHYWDPSQLVRKPSTQAGYLLTVLVALGYAALLAALARRPLRMLPRTRRMLVAGAQLLCLAAVAACWIAQRHLVYARTHRVYFTTPTALFALVAAALVCVLVPVASRRRGRVPAAIGRLARGERAVAVACLVIAALLTALWLLPVIYRDANVSLAPSELQYVNGFFLDETLAVINGRSPLVNMVAYGNVWPYLVAGPLWVFGETYLAFTLLMALVTGMSLVCVYAMLRRVTTPAAALGLYVPVLATTLFTIHGNVSRYDPGDYFGMFPLRYAGPYLLAWLTARQLAGERTSRVAPTLLFLVGGLVALNNVDFGVAALAATVVALLVTMGAQLRRLLRSAVAGIALAVALVSIVTVVRAGSLPHLWLLARYGRVFVAGGFGNLALPGPGFHLVITMTFVAALATAVTRSLQREPNRVLTGMLAWAGVFGLGASVYFYAYRSHPDVLISLFSAWSLALALLAVAVLQRAWLGMRMTLARFAVLVGFGLTVPSVLQLPGPVAQLDRIAAIQPIEPFREIDAARIVASRTHHGEPVVILSAVGHRIAEEVGVVNVSPYTGLDQMPTREQLQEALRALENAGGRKVFVGQVTLWPPAADRFLQRAGYRRGPTWQGLTPGNPFTDMLIEYVRAP
jgi:hypothetical protein